MPDERAKAEAVLEFMHKQLLSRHALYQTRFDVLLSTGLYNKAKTLAEAAIAEFPKEPMFQTLLANISRAQAGL
jgi:hypothetical protein